MDSRQVPWLPDNSSFVANARPRSSFAHSSSSSHAAALAHRNKRARSTSLSSDSSTQDDDRNDDSRLDDTKWYYDESGTTTTTQNEGGDDASLNVGMRMLLKLGWTQGKGLGKDLQGRVDPIDPKENSAMMGLGKQRMDNEMIELTVQSGARQLESTRFAKETDDQRKARMERAAQVAQVKADVAATLDKFRCDICDKAYANVSQYNEHLNSYDHHHRARFVATKQAEKERLLATGAADKRREKERKREEKELARAMGVSAVKPVLLTSTSKPSMNKQEAPMSAAAAPKRGGWAKIGDTATTTATAPSRGFVPVGSATSSTSSVSNDPTVRSGNNGGRVGGGFKKTGWTSTGFEPRVASERPSDRTETATLSSKMTAPRFESAGSFDLDKSTFGGERPSSTRPQAVVDTVMVPAGLPPPMPPSEAAPPPPPPPPLGHDASGWSTLQRQSTPAAATMPLERGTLLTRDATRQLHPALVDQPVAPDARRIVEVEQVLPADRTDKNKETTANVRKDHNNWNKWQQSGKLKKR
ncbi:hypothetical protein OIO90_001437 [Microbotryomycetes sp. JL221]|nr:hypothetical protein OIO90_001437 [Microbotryomycetes sp. JL221]